MCPSKVYITYNNYKVLYSSALLYSPCCQGLSVLPEYVSYIYISVTCIANQYQFFVLGCLYSSHRSHRVSDDLLNFLRTEDILHFRRDLLFQGTLAFCSKASLLILSWQRPCSLSIFVLICASSGNICQRTATKTQRRICQIRCIQWANTHFLIGLEPLQYIFSPKLFNSVLRLRPLVLHM